MKNRILTFLKKYKYILIIWGFVVLVGIISIMSYLAIYNKSSSIIIENNNYAIKIDNSWKVKNKADKSVNFKNGKSDLKFDIVTLKNEHQYSSITDILDDLLYDILEQNKNYRLIAKEKFSATKNKYDGYKMLYEVDDQQAMVVILKKGNQLGIVTYVASNSYFDILLDSVYNIIYSLTLKDEKVNLRYKMKLSISDIPWNENKNITTILKEQSKYEIANNNYLVKYSIPSNFKLQSFNSVYQYFEFEGLSDIESHIKLSTSILQENIYEYLDENKANGTVYYNYKFNKENENTKNFKEFLNDYSNDLYKIYIYKNSFSSSLSVGTTHLNNNYENVELIYAIDKSRVFVIKIEGKDLSIPEELIKNIRIDSVLNYASYSNKTMNGDIQISDLKHYIDYNKNQKRTIKISLSKKYKEIDHNDNIYECRYYGLEYNMDTELYKYYVEYQTFLNIDLALKSFNFDINSYKSYGKYQTARNKSIIEVNGKSFQYYEGGYTKPFGSLFSSYKKNTYYVNEKMFVYVIDDNKCLAIVIKGNDVEINDGIVKEVVNFDIKEEN